MANGKYQISSIIYQVSYIKWKMSNGRCQMEQACIKHFTFNSPQDLFRRICSTGFVPRETIHLYNMQNQPITKKNKN